ncbi:hypothetical protein SORBI_3008G069401 [Sorghum bicolor]|uniref:Uncharacterized protein n=1 Tax=Sorghum bicolor TaxID=4558 RepID=A0A1Z5R5R0_SORBI|nr:hypothetical protein SORBI_3008G069401 [Sorghum bicolor]OQU78902.1 hypothetical protein SORBI_3008G069401 [Sorghum bicolor]
MKGSNQYTGSALCQEGFGKASYFKNIQIQVPPPSSTPCCLACTGDGPNAMIHIGFCASATKPPCQTPRCLTCSRSRPITAPAYLQDHNQFEKRRGNFTKEIDIVDVISYQAGPYPSQ